MELKSCLRSDVRTIIWVNQSCILIFKLRGGGGGGSKPFWGGGHFEHRVPQVPLVI